MTAICLLIPNDNQREVKRRERRRELDFLERLLANGINIGPATNDAEWKEAQVQLVLPWMHALDEATVTARVRSTAD